jgi:hypothetical protein
VFSATFLSIVARSRGGPGLSEEIFRVDEWSVCSG